MSKIYESNSDNNNNTNRYVEVDICGRGQLA